MFDNISSSIEDLVKKLPQLVQASIESLRSRKVLLGCESVVAAAFSLQVKSDSAKYLRLRDKLDSATARELVDAVFAQPDWFPEKYKGLSNHGLVMEETRLIAAAVLRSECVEGAVRAYKASSKFDFERIITQIRVSFLLYFDIAQCSIELQQRGISTNIFPEISVNAEKAMLFAATALAKLLPNTNWYQKVSAMLLEKIAEETSGLKGKTNAKWTATACGHIAVKMAMKGLTAYSANDVKRVAKCP